MDGKAGPSLRQAQYFAAEQLQPVSAVGAAQLGFQQVANVVPEGLPGDEAARRPIGQFWVILYPVQEIGWPVMERAHAAGRHVQEMVRIARGIGVPTPEALAAFGQQHCRPAGRAPQDVQCQQGAAETCADDGERCAHWPVHP